MMLYTIVPIALGLLRTAHAHADHGPVVVPEGADWATRHMIEEHHIQSFDAGSFFTLHDYDGTNEWTPEDILKTYGLMDESNDHVSGEDKDKLVQKIVDLYDRDQSGTISFAEYTIGEAQGIKLPDMGYGPGHHGDDEYEYEIHHWELYHDENTTEEDLIHPEDIEHFRKHELMEEAQRHQEEMDQMPIVEANIPNKFWRD